VSRSALVYIFLPVVLIAAMGLAWSSYRSSLELANRKHHLMLNTLRELAQEKVFGIESEIKKVESDLFEAIEIDDMDRSQQRVLDRRLPVESVLVLDQDGEIIPGGFYTSRNHDEFRRLFEGQIRPDLALSTAPLARRFHLHATYDGRPFLFAGLRRFDGGRMFFVIVDIDLTYLVSAVFPQFFEVRSPRIYQVVDEGGDIRYGFSFAGVERGDVVELGFPETLTRWQLRVAQREAGSLSARGETQATVDLLLVGMALAVIVAGFGFMVWAMRRERRLSELKSDFISNVSHELKTPLSIISMFGELLSMGRARTPEQTAEYAEIIRRESVRLSRLIDNVLDFSKIERGVDVYEFADGEDLGEIVSRALEISSHRLDSAELELEVEIEDDLPTARLDANAMTLAVLNLVDNAIKYAADGGKVVVSVRRDEAGSSPAIVLEVRDFGPGVPAEERDQIFERFYRARSVRLKPIRGSGIGLALVRHIAEAHGGSIAALDADGGGACFRLRVPA
jgi:two-component system phosphate regulon sensor histidine kinase PhoR